MESADPSTAEQEELIIPEMDPFTMMELSAAENLPGPSRPSAEVAGPSSSSNETGAAMEQDSDSDEYDEFETSDEDESVGNEDYVVLPRQDGDEPGPSTRKIAPIRKDRLLPFKQLYEKQPQKIKEMIRLNFYKGKPVVEPQPLDALLNQIKHMKIARKLELRRKRNLRKKYFSYNRNKSVYTVDSDAEEDTRNVVEIHEDDDELVHVDYPARIVNYERALATMGGIGNLSKVFDNPNKKLSVKFRPDDIYCNPVKGEAQPTIAILLRVRTRKTRKLPVVKKTETKEQEEQDPVTIDIEQEESDPVVVVNGVPLSKSQILEEDRELLKNKLEESKLLMKNYPVPEEREPYYLKLPRNYTKPKLDKKIQIDAMGIVSKSYKFDGLCDFQYLPLKKTESGEIVSNRQNILPIIGHSNGNGENLTVSESLLKDEKEFDLALLPPMMSRIDHPLDTIGEGFIDAANVKLDTHLKERPSGIIATSRTRRNVYTVFHSFPSEKLKSNNPVPTTPLEGALEDVKRRPQCANSVQEIAKMFEEKPIWSKNALEAECKLSSFALKYVLPCVAFFANNGPWRNLWIRFGFDPRENSSAFYYQTVDFRLPAEYRSFLNDAVKNDSYHIFRPTYFPPRYQMFYQLCHLKCEEFDKLVETANDKSSKNKLQYDIRFGWLKEGTFEYIRHVLLQYIEILLEDLGKIPEYPIQKVFLPDGALEPKGKLISRPRKVKRLRKVRTFPLNKTPDTGAATATATATASTSNAVESPTKTKSPKKGKNNKESKGKWAYQGILQDLSIKEINKYGVRDDSRSETIDEVSLLLDDDDDFEDETEYDSEENDDAEDDYLSGTRR